ncbi:MAG TPA: EAL domain-containing protein [Dermatophilaceae bacterium]|nr:EAL domain-containing protein [Dermatophilaceae bacterium]
MPSLRRRKQGSRLFALYVLASLVPISVIGVVAVRGDAQAGSEFGRDWGRAQSAVIEQMAIAPALRGADLSLGLNKAERGRLQSATDLAIFNGTVSHLRLRSFDGTVEFSDNGSAAGSVPVTDPAFQAAAAGRTDVRLFEGSPHSPGVVRVLQPVIAAANGMATGVLEVYLPYDAIATKVQAETRTEMIRVALSLVGLFALLALISYWTTRALRQSAATHEYESLHDSMTGLPNRELFRRTAEDALDRGRRGEQGAVVLIDLDHFKEVNDTLGHHAGDELLRIVGRRLRGSLRTDDMVARLGGDEFAMVLPRGGDRDETLALLYRIRDELGEEVVLDGVSLSVEASFGVCFYPESAETVEDLLQHADAAMYRGKQGRGIVVYEAATAHHATHALLIQRELRRALDRDELVLHYQPKVKLSSGRVTCLEALVRWQQPERGLLLPSEFLLVAERCELIEPLTTWVLRRALADYAAWTAAGHDWMVAVNVSARNLTSPDFAVSVGRILHEAGVPPNRLRLEVSEAALTFDAELAKQAIGALADQGISISMDHFGMGLTDLAQMCTTYVSEIKIDRTFLGGLPGNERDRAIVRSVIDLGHGLGCLVTAQGVDSQDVADALKDAGCDDAQGHLWLRPGPWTEVARMFGATGTPTDTTTMTAMPPQTTRGSEKASR